MRLRKRKKVLNKQRRRVNGLKLILEDNRGKATGYFEENAWASVSFLILE